MALTWDAAQFASAYSVRDRRPGSPTFGQRLGYGREMAEAVMAPGQPGLTMYEHRRDQLISLFSLSSQDRILIGGCGYGFLIEVFRDAGYSSCWGIDDSPHVAANKASQARADIANEWVVNDIRSGGQARNALRQLTGDDIFDWVITEQLLESFADAELPTVFGAADAVTAPGGSVIHLVVPLQQPNFLADGVPVEIRQNAEMNWKLMSEWKALAPSHTFVNLNNWQVF